MPDDAPTPIPTPPPNPAPAGPWYTQGASHSIWYFVAATFAFAWATFTFTDHVPVWPWLLVAAGLLALALGIAVFTRPLRRAGGDPQRDVRRRSTP